MVCLVAVATLTLVDLAQFELLAPGRMELFAQPEALRAQLEWKAGHAAAGEPYFRCRFAPNPQGQFVEQDELKRPAQQGPILSQLGRLAPAAASAAMRGELGAFTRWMAKSVTGSPSSPRSEWARPPARRRLLRHRRRARAPRPAGGRVLRRSPRCSTRCTAARRCRAG